MAKKDIYSLDWARWIDRFVLVDDALLIRFAVFYCSRKRINPIA
jgi:hypothetical protein